MAAAANEDGEIREGFLCPICKEDLKTAAQLTEHFETLHQEDQDVLKSLRSIFGKAKKKILNIDEIDLKETLDKTLKLSTVDSFYADEEQTIGVTRSFTDYFKAVRSSRLERYATETNKLLIRLDKLVSNMPTDAAQRKQHEQNVVPWLDGTAVNLCPSCARAFNLARRKHHCRLCGSILCHDCSLFLNLDIARRMVEPGAGRAGGAGAALRLCGHCLGLVELRRRVQEARNTTSVVVTAYEQMRALILQAEPLIDTYKQMCGCLLEGESKHSVDEVNSVRGRVGRLAEGVEELSKQIAALPAEPGSRQHQLHLAVRQAAAKHIKERMLSLPRLPSEAEMEACRRARYERAERQIREERRRAELAAAPPQPAPSLASAAAHTLQDDHPLFEQMSIVREYIRQAREHNRHEEVKTLEENLRELKKEYQLQLLALRSPQTQ